MKMESDDVNYPNSKSGAQHVTLDFQTRRRDSELRDFSQLQSLCQSLISLLNTYNAALNGESPYFDNVNSTEMIMKETFNNCGPPLLKDLDEDSSFSIRDIVMEVSNDQLELDSDGYYHCCVKGHTIRLSENQRKVVFNAFPLFFKRSLSLEGMQQESAANKETYGLFKAQCEMHLNRGKQSYAAWLKHSLIITAIHKAIQFSEELQKRSRVLDNEIDRSLIHDLLREPSPPTEQMRESPCATLTRENLPHSSTSSEDGGDIAYGEGDLSRPKEENRTSPSTTSTRGASPQASTVSEGDSTLESSCDHPTKKLKSSKYPESTARHGIPKSLDEETNGFAVLKNNHDKGLSWAEIRMFYADRFKIWRSALSLQRWHREVSRQLSEGNNDTHKTHDESDYRLVRGTDDERDHGPEYLKKLREVDKVPWTTTVTLYNEKFGTNRTQTALMISLNQRKRKSTSQAEGNGITDCLDNKARTSDEKSHGFDFLAGLRDDGLIWPQLTKSYNERFGTHRTSDSLRHWYDKEKRQQHDTQEDASVSTHPHTMFPSNSRSEEEMADGVSFLKTLRDEGMTWANVTKPYNVRFGTDRTEKSVQTWYSKTMRNLPRLKNKATSTS